MENGTTLSEFGPSRPVACLIAAIGATAGVVASLDSDRPGRFLLGCVAVVLLVLSASDLIFWPRLRATRAGLTLTSPAVRRQLSWAEVDIIRVDERSHLGLASRALEIEADALLVVLSKRALGCDPRVAFDELHRLRPT